MKKHLLFAIVGLIILTSFLSSAYNPIELDISFSDYALDADDNGLYDYLVFQIEGLRRGEYIVDLSIRDQYNEDYHVEQTCKVSQNVKCEIKFKGTFINHEGKVNSTYKIEEIDLTINAVKYDLLNSYTSPNYYSYYEFESNSPPRFNITDYGLDIDNNGLYEYLVFEFNGIKSGFYELDATIIDSSGEDYDVDEYPDGCDELPVGEKCKLVLNGEDIYEAGINGKFFLQELIVEEIFPDGSLEYNYFNYYNSSFYNFQDFEQN